MTYIRTTYNSVIYNFYMCNFDTLILCVMHLRRDLDPTFYSRWTYKFTREFNLQFSTVYLQNNNNNVAETDDFLSKEPRIKFIRVSETPVHETRRALYIQPLNTRLYRVKLA